MFTSFQEIYVPTYSLLRGVLSQNLFNILMYYIIREFEEPYVHKFDPFSPKAIHTSISIIFPHYVSLSKIKVWVISPLSLWLRISSLLAKKIMSRKGLLFPMDNLIVFLSNFVYALCSKKYTPVIFILLK